MNANLSKFGLILSIVIFFIAFNEASGQEMMGAENPVIHEVTQPFSTIKHSDEKLLANDYFDFNDGTVQDWYVAGPYDESGNGPFSSHFSASWADAVSYPTAGLADPIGNNNGSYKICNVMGHGITNPGATYWYMYWFSPLLSSNSAWQNASGYRVKILNYMELIGAVPGVHLQLWVQLFVTVYDLDQGRNRYFSATTSYQSIQNWLQNPAWIDKSFDFANVFAAVPNRRIEEIYVGVRGRMADYFEGGIYLDEVRPISSGSPMISLSASNLDFGMFKNNLSFGISNIGSGTLDWTVTEAPNVPWITSLSPASGSGDAIVNVIVDRNQLSQNVETGNLLVSSNGGNENVTVTVARDTVSQWFRTDIETKLLAGDGQAVDNFGHIVSLHGDYAVIGSPYDDNGNGTDAGAVYIFQRSGETWIQQQKLLASDGVGEDLFGYSVDISGDYIVAGSCWDDDAGEKSGSAYIFKRQGSTWVQQAKLTASDAGADNRFGIDVAISGDYVIVGAFFDDDFGTRSGSAYIFMRSGSVWVEQKILHASDGAANDWFGVSVDIYGDYAAVGARYDDNENGIDAGSVYVFKRTGSDWLEQKKIIASDGAADDQFSGVAIYGDHLIVGTGRDDDLGENSGSIYIFHRVGNDWIEQEKHTASDGDTGDLFGSVSIYENRIVVGAHRNNDLGDNSGSIYIFSNNGTSWTEEMKIIASDGDAGDFLGLSVAIFGDFVIAGARNDDDLGNNAGAAYVYHLPSQPGAPVLSVNPTTLDFGTSFSSLTLQISNIGAPGLTWNIAVLSSMPWLVAITPFMGTDNATVTVTVDRTKLTGASASGTIRVSSNGGTQSVTLLIAKEPALLPDNWNFTANTGNSATVVLPTTANPNIDGVPLQNGDYIGVFTPAGLCCGWKQWQGANISITAWGNNDQTPELDGFQSGENINYRVYRISGAQEWDIVQVDYSQGTGKYASNAFMVLNKFDVTSQRSITLNFATGWNMFSINVVPDDPNIATVMSPVVSKLVLAKNGAGQTYIPAYGINDINAMTYDAGYQAYFTEATPLDVSGAPLAADTPINLAAGWSMVSYLPTVPISAATALTSINSQLVIAKDNQGRTYIPAYGINDIGAMQQGQGYLMYLQAVGTLVYPAGFIAKVETVSSPTVEHFSFISNTGENATLVIPTDIKPGYSDGRPLETGDEIAVFTTDGLCCGAISWEGTNKAITVWGNNSQTSQVDGFTAGDTFRFRVWHKASNTEFKARVSFQPGHSPVYQANGFSVLTQLIADLSTVAVEQSATEMIPSTFQLMQNHPNPFNPVTQISYHLPHSTKVSLKIYNIQGQVIKTLVDEFQTAGIKSVVWNGLDEQGRKVASGIYVYQLTAGQFSMAKKMLLIQ